MELEEHACVRTSMTQERENLSCEREDVLRWFVSLRLIGILYTFKVHNVLIRHIYILQYDYYHSIS